MPASSFIRRTTTPSLTWRTVCISLWSTCLCLQSVVGRCSNRPMVESKGELLEIYALGGLRITQGGAPVAKQAPVQIDINVATSEKQLNADVVRSGVCHKSRGNQRRDRSHTITRAHKQIDVMASPDCRAFVK